MKTDIVLACEHNPALAQIAIGGQTAWCYICEKHVATARTQEGNDD
jgi:hypothetical protein